MVMVMVMIMIVIMIIIMYILVKRYGGFFFLSSEEERETRQTRTAPLTVGQSNMDINSRLYMNK
jgi:hypothetical protein